MQQAGLPGGFYGNAVKLLAFLYITALYYLYLHFAVCLVSRRTRPEKAAAIVQMPIYVAHKISHCNRRLTRVKLNSYIAELCFYKAMYRRLGEGIYADEYGEDNEQLFHSVNVMKDEALK